MPQKCDISHRISYIAGMDLCDEIISTNGARVIEKIPHAGKEVDHRDDMGLSIVIPEGSISPMESVELIIQPSFNEIFETPKGFEPASPAYLIETSKKIELKKPLLVKMQHYIRTENENDCSSMVFLRASSVPGYRGSDPVYVFKEAGVKGKFHADGSQYGEIELIDFSWWRIFSRRRIRGS